jgi:hypothetical protein
MTDTAQPGLAAENVSLDEAANAFKSFLNPQTAQPRDETGRFSSAQPEEAEEDEVLDDADEASAGDAEGEDDAQEVDEAADEAQPDAVDMPSSWSKEDADLWASLPAEAQGKIAEREAQRDAGLNQKLQEAANARKLVEQQAAEANANRDAYARAIDEVAGLLQYPKPAPTDYGAGTENYDRESYDLAVYQWEQTQTQLQSLFQQRQAIAAQQEHEEARQRTLAHQEIEETAWPKFLADVPDLADAAKGRQIISGLVEYGAENGINKDAFSAGNVTSVEMRLLWKAKEYDRIKSAEQRVKATNPQPKPASPAIKPGGATTRQTVQANRLNKATSRLAKEGSIEAGADVFKHFLSR